jgi:hypothetical protein
MYIFGNMRLRKTSTTSKPNNFLGKAMSTDHADMQRRVGGDRITDTVAAEAVVQQVVQCFLR